MVVWFNLFLFAFDCLGIAVGICMGIKAIRARRQLQAIRRNAAAAMEARNAIERMTVAQRTTAHEKALQLLKDNLTPEQRAMWNSSRQFFVKGGTTGKTYLLGNGRVSLIKRCGVDRKVFITERCYCIVPTVTMPIGDHVLAQKVAFESNETWALQTAIASGA